MNPLLQLRERGQSVWLDYIRRHLITSGDLQHLVESDGLGGVTSNPAIFEKAIAGSSDYRDALQRLAARGGCGLKTAGPRKRTPFGAGSPTGRILGGQSHSYPPRAAVSSGGWTPTLRHTSAARIEMKRSSQTRARRQTSRGAPRTLAIDIGGSGVKAAVLDGRGGIIGERVRVKTPARCPPAFLIRTIAAPGGAAGRVRPRVGGVSRGRPGGRRPNGAELRQRKVARLRPGASPLTRS